MQAFGLGCLDFFTSVLDFIPEQIRGHLDLFVLGELGIYMYRDEKHASRLFLSLMTTIDATVFLVA